MSLTLSQCYNRVAVNLEDVDPNTGAPAFVYRKKAWLVDWINDAVKAITRAIPQKRYVTFTANPNPVIIANRTAEYVPATYDALSQIDSIQAGNYNLTQKTVQWLASRYFDWDTRTGTPEWFVYNDLAPGVLKLVPDPGETMTTVRGIATVKIPPLVVTTDDATPLPVDDEDFHELVELYATSKALRMPGETQNAQESDRLMALFVAGLQDYKVKQARNYSSSSRELECEQF